MELIVLKTQTKQDEIEMKLKSLTASSSRRGMHLNQLSLF